VIFRLEEKETVYPMRVQCCYIACATAKPRQSKRDIIHESDLEDAEVGASEEEAVGASVDSIIGAAVGALVEGVGTSPIDGAAEEEGLTAEEEGLTDGAIDETFADAETQSVRGTSSHSSSK
jgi:hypothetical protein